MRRLYYLIFSLLLFYSRLLGQGALPLSQKDFTAGGTKIDRAASVMQTPKDYSIVLGGTTSSSATGEVTPINKGKSDFWVIQYDSNYVYKWNKIYGGTKSDTMSLMVDKGDGSYLLAGSSNSGVGGDKTGACRGDYDYWIVRIDKNGTKVWDATFGGDSTDILTGAEADSDGGFILVGYSLSKKSGDKSGISRGNKDYWIVKCSSAGTKMWDVTIGGDSIDVATNVILLKGGFLVGGYSISNISGEKTENSYGGYDYWTLFIDKSGNLVWQKTYGGNQHDFMDDAVLCTRGVTEILLGGTSESSASGNKNSPNYGMKDYWMIRIDSVGSVVWERDMGGASNDIFTDCISTLEGSYAIAGYSNSGGGPGKGVGTNGGSDFYFLKLTRTGAVYWEKNYGGALNDTCSWVYQNCDRGYILGGWSNSNIGFDKTENCRGQVDYWAVKLWVPTLPDFGNQTICLGAPMQFTDLTNVWPDKWKWNFGDAFCSPENNTSNDQHPLHTYSYSGTYDVKLTVSEGCQNDTVVYKKVNVLVNKVLGKMDLGADTSVCVQHEIELFNKKDIPAGSTYLWSTGDTTPSIITDTIGFYTLTVTNGQCSEQDIVEVDYCPEIFIPNAFTPNGDGKNDLFYIYGVGLREVEYLIYDRWGNHLFTGVSQDVGWDGYYKGDLVQIDVYVYKVKYKGINTKERVKYGRVTVIR